MYFSASRAADQLSFGTSTVAPAAGEVSGTRPES